MSEVEEVLKDSSASFWLKEAIKALDNRDIVDALSDIECLEKIFRAKMDWINNLYVCKDCNESFRHYYDVVPDIFEAMRGRGVKEECATNDKQK